MSTNYYLKRIPTIDDALEVSKIMMNNPYKVGGKDVLSQRSLSDAVRYIEKLTADIHIGKFSGGWRFCCREHIDLYDSTLDDMISYIDRMITLGKYKLVNDNCSSVSTADELKEVILSTMKGNANRYSVDEYMSDGIIWSKRDFC